MGTREVYEEKLRSANLHYDPTMNPGLGSARCPRCLSLIDPNSRNGESTITSVLHDFTAVAGSGLGALLTAVHGFNTGIPYVQKHVKGPKWVQLAIGLSNCYRCKSAQNERSCNYSSTPNVFWSWCCLWSICSSKVCTAHRVILLRRLRWVPLCNFTGYPAYRRAPCFSKI